MERWKIVLIIIGSYLVLFGIPNLLPDESKKRYLKDDNKAQDYVKKHPQLEFWMERVFIIGVIILIIYIVK